MGQRLHCLDFVHAYFSLVLKCDLLWVPLSFSAVPAIWYCTGVMIAIVHIYFLCSGHSGFVATVLFSWVYFLLVVADNGVSLFGMRCFWYFSLYSSSVSTLVGGGIWYFTLGSLELCFIRGYGGVGSASLFESWIYASFFSNYLITLSW